MNIFRINEAAQYCLEEDTIKYRKIYKALFGSDARYFVVSITPNIYFDHSQLNALNNIINVAGYDVHDNYLAVIEPVGGDVYNLIGIFKSAICQHTNIIDHVIVYAQIFPATYAADQNQYSSSDIDEINRCFKAHTASIVNRIKKKIIGSVVKQTNIRPSSQTKCGTEWSYNALAKDKNWCHDPDDGLILETREQTLHDNKNFCENNTIQLINAGNVNSLDDRTLAQMAELMNWPIPAKTRKRMFEEYFKRYTGFLFHEDHRDEPNILLTFSNKSSDIVIKGLYVSDTADMHYVFSLLAILLDWCNGKFEIYDKGDQLFNQPVDAHEAATANQFSKKRNVYTLFVDKSDIAALMDSL